MKCISFRCHPFFIALLCCAMLSSFPAAAQPDKVTLNFVNADIPEVVKAVSVITGRNFLIDPRVKGSINIISSSPVPPALAYDILLSALRLQGYAAVESNGVTKVLPESDAKLYVSTTQDKHNSGDKLVTRVYMLKHESANQLVGVIRPLVSPNNIVVAYPNNNALVVTDYASNLKRIEQIVDSIDQPSAEVPVVIPVTKSSAVDLAQTINRLMQDGSSANAADASQRFVLIADARNNVLLVRSDNPARLARVRELVEKLDVETSAPGNVHVIYLKNADATKIAQTLRAIISGDTSAAPAGSPNTAPTAPVGPGTVQADAGSNALIITAPAALYNNLRAVVDLLDVRRAQVFVEALIAEVTADKAAEFGVQWQDLTGINRAGGQIIGGTNFGGVGTNIIGAAGNISTVGQGLNIGLVRGQMNIPGVGTVINLGMLARALENDANANILSTPNLLTLDNEEAKIVIGQNVPFITGQYAQTGTTSTASPFQTIERKDVGLTLRIKPQISEGGTVKLQIYQEVSSVLNQTLNNTAGVITNKRSLESSVLVEGGQIVVLGGLIQDSVNNTESKVPLLGDIPILGNLFRYESRHRTKTNLMVFIRPYILRNAPAMDGLTQDRYEYLIGTQNRGAMPERILLPELSDPQLPPLTLRAEPGLPSFAQPASPVQGAEGKADAAIPMDKTR